MSAMQQIRELRAWARGRADSYKELKMLSEEAVWQVKVDTYDTVIKLLEEEKERENAGFGKGKEVDSR